jgi:hypothetical protein
VDIEVVEKQTSRHCCPGREKPDDKETAESAEPMQND